MSDRTSQSKSKAAFLAAYRQCGNVTEAADATQLDRRNHYLWLKDDAEYAKDFEDAKDEAKERLESEARRRAQRGVQKLKTYKGELIYVPENPEDPTSKRVPLIEHEYSDNLLMFLLKKLDPSYRDASPPATNPDTPVEMPDFSPFNNAPPENDQDQGK